MVVIFQAYCKDQCKIDDFMDRNGFLGKKVVNKSCKNDVSDGEVLLKSDDSLTFFYIQNYCVYIILKPVTLLKKLQQQ